VIGGINVCAWREIIADTSAEVRSAGGLMLFKLVENVPWIIVKQIRMVKESVCAGEQQTSQ
jgi:hypothetical protein